MRVLVCVLLDGDSMTTPIEFQARSERVHEYASPEEQRRALKAIFDRVRAEYDDEQREANLARAAEKGRNTK